jgi:hypothetical protein
MSIHSLVKRQISGPRLNTNEIVDFKSGIGNDSIIGKWDGAVTQDVDGCLRAGAIGPVGRKDGPRGMPDLIQFWLI